MGNGSEFKPSETRAPEDLEELYGVADEADIPKPSARILREEEVGAQARRKDTEDLGTLPRNLSEAVRVVKAMEQKGQRVEGSSEALMEYLKDQQGDALSADLLEAMATLMAAIPERRKEKKKSLMHLYFQWARNKTTSMITKIVGTFKPKK